MRYTKSTDTVIIENIFSQCKVGETVTYDELSKAIGRDVRKFASGSIQTTLKTMLAEHNMVFGNEKNVGYVRIANDTVVNSVNDYDARQTQRISKRSLQKLSTVNFGELSEDGKKKHIVASSRMGAIAMFSQKSAVKKIESHIKDSSHLPIGETLKLFQ